MTYPSSSPWGPHGPQVPANSVTPNPTAPSAPYVPSPSAPAPVDYGQPSRGGGGGGGGYGASYRSGPAAPPSPKSVLVAVFLSLLLAPTAVWYATFGTRRFMSGMFFTGIAIVALVFRPTLWIPVTVISLIWSIGAIGTHNREVKKARAAAKRV